MLFVSPMLSKRKRKDRLLTRAMLSKVIRYYDLKREVNFVVLEGNLNVIVINVSCVSTGFCKMATQRT